MKMNKGYQFRIYPNKEQQKKIAETFGCVRFVYNHYLNVHEIRHKNGEKRLTKIDCNNDCNRVLKDAYPWLRDVDKFAITNSIYNLDDAYIRFFDGVSEHPRFKKKRTKQSYTTNINGKNIKLLNKHVQLPKLGKVKAKIHRRPPDDWRLKKATVKRTASGEYYVSLLYEYETEIQPVEPKTFIGFDFSVPKLFVSSEAELQTDDTFLQNYRKTREKLSREKRILSHRKRGSHRYIKQKLKVARIEEHIANQRKDYLHKVSTEIANRYDAVCVEDISMEAITDRMNAFYKSVGRKKNAGLYVMDNGFYGFTVMLDYKLTDRGKQLVKVDIPSTQICSDCGYLNADITLSDRTWTCSNCGETHDRDVNAAINIEREGRRMLA